MEQTTATQTAKRPGFLTVLCILSWVFQGIAAVIYLLAIGGGAAVEASAAAAGVETGTGSIWTWILVGFVGLIISFVGVLQMWKLKKMGFFLYGIAFAIGIINDIMFSDSGISWFSVVVGGGFIAMYAVNMKAMK